MLRGLLKFGLFLFWCILLVPFQLLIVLIYSDARIYILPQFWHRQICRVFEITIETTGQPVLDRPVLYAGNHVSYLDIPVISCILRGAFVAKEEVASWPLFGFLAKLQQTAFISRARHHTHKSKDAIENRINQGDKLVIFPEGTSSDGRQALPFKSSLFSAALSPDVPSDLLVQPFTIELCETEGVPVTTQERRDLYAWYGDMTLMPHFWAFAKSRGAKVKLHFHPPLPVKQFDNRKKLAQACYEQVSQVLSGSHDVKSKE